MNYGITITKECFIYKNEELTEVSDEILSGWLVAYERADGNVVKILTSYGYEGYANRCCFRAVSIQDIQEKITSGSMRRIISRTADVLEAPLVQAPIVCMLLRNSVVRILDENNSEWTHIKTADGNTGYIHSAFLGKLMNQDRLYFGCDYRNQKITEEYVFREKVVESAMSYLNTQYRWGGKSVLGIDCSGLAFMSYFENGLIIYRDASIKANYPVHEIDLSKIMMGDLIYFTGHMAVYIGNGRYIHATAHNSNPCVTINSLNPQDTDYREDLAKNITACGSVF